MKKIVRTILILSIALTSLFANAEFDSFKKSLENSDTRVREILLDSNINRTLDRAEAVVLLDAVLVNNGFEQDISTYLNPFSDIDLNSDYSRSVIRLAYFKGTKSIETPLTKDNTLFRPLDKVSRQEFIKMVIEGSDVTIDEGHSWLIDFSDKDSISPWAVKYMNTAVHYGVVFGDNNYLKPLDNLTIYEALLILYRMEKLIQGSSKVNGYSVEGFQTPDEINFDGKIENSIGDLSSSEYYISSQTPIKIDTINIVNETDASKMSQCSSTNVIILEANTIHDSRSEVKVTYQWKSNAGYFKKISREDNYKKVCFYPANNKQSFDYLIKVNASDNIGYEDSFSTNIPSSIFTYPTTNSNYVTDLDNKSGVVYSNFKSIMVAGKPYILDISESKVVRNSLNLGIENVVVNLIKPNNEKIFLYRGRTIDGVISFNAPVMPRWYGKNVKLEVIINTQNFSDSIITPSISYQPIYEISGKIYNNIHSEQRAKYIAINNHTIKISEDGSYNYELPIGYNLSNIVLNVIDKSASNYFEPVTINLSTYQPDAMIDFFAINKTAMNNENDNVDPTQPSAQINITPLGNNKFRVLWSAKNTDSIEVKYAYKRDGDYKRFVNLTVKNQQTGNFSYPL